MDWTTASERARPGMTSGALPELFARPGTLQALRPPTREEKQLLSNMDSPGFLEVYPRSGDKRPILMAKLEAMLMEKIRVAERMVSPAYLAQEKRGTNRAMGAANLRLDAHRQVFEAFIQAFTTYRPLLRRIKDEYEQVLDDGLRASHENIVMRAELAVSEQRKHRAVEEARAEAAASAAALRAELHARLMEAEERAKSRGKARLEQELNQMRKTMQATLQEMAEMKQKYEDVMKLMQEESSFSKNGAESLANLKMGGKTAAEAAKKLKDDV